MYTLVRDLITDVYIYKINLLCFKLQKNSLLISVKNDALYEYAENCYVKLLYEINIMQ